MENLIKNLFFYQWQRKLVALITATVIWIFVNHTIIMTKIIPSVPIRVINLPNDQTMIGLQPNGFLTKRLTLTLTGTKDVVEELEPGDLEVVLDVANRSGEWVLTMTKKNLVSLNPNINLSNHITAVDYPELIIKMSPVLSEEIPITIHQPIGEAPNGYEFLDLWPIFLIQKVTGPQEQVLNLKHEGLEITFNFSDVTKEELDALQPNGTYDDVIDFMIPDHWKKVKIPFGMRNIETINDPEAKLLHMSFLRKQPIPLKNNLPILIFYPLRNSAAINPQTYALSAGPFVKMNHEIPVLTVPLYVNNVSKLFLDIVKDNLQLEIVTAPKAEREKLDWSVGFVDSAHLEDTYVAFLLSNSRSGSRNTTKNQERENFFRQRFRKYMQNFNLYLSPQHKLEIDSSLDEHQIRVHVPNASVKSGTDAD
ncbi:MAG: hypothetical protein ACHQUC_09325 [Chlamydiales bacterium]